MKPAKQILVIDDDPCGCDLLGDLIRVYGFQVDFATSCQAARQQIQLKSYDGLVLDMWMKDGTGDEMLTWLRGNGRQEPVVVVSDTADYDQWIDLVNKGASDLLAKPVVPDQLERALQLAIGMDGMNDRRFQRAEI